MSDCDMASSMFAPRLCPSTSTHEIRSSKEIIMLDNSKDNNLQHHIDPKTGARYVSTTDASGKHTLTVDEENAHLLRDVCWTVAPVRKGSDKLQARASTAAPRVKKGALLHRRVFKSLRRDRSIRTLN